MTTATGPIETAFALQREFLEAGRQSITQSTQLQRQAGEALLDLMETQRELQRQGFDQAQSVSKSTISASESAFPGGEGALAPMQDSVEAFFDAAQDNQDALGETLLAATAEGVEQRSAANDQLMEIANESFDLLQDAHVEYEEQTLAAMTELFDRLEELQSFSQQS